MAKDTTENNQLVKDYIQAATEAGQSKPENKAVGNNGYKLGETFTATGLQVVTTEIKGKKAVYVGITTQEGRILSIKSVMGVSSMTGYETEGTFDNEKLDGGQVVADKITAEVIPNFDFNMVFQPSCRELLDFIAEAESTKFFVGKTITYLGKVVRPFVSSKNSPATSFETYKKGFKRAMAVRLWSVTA